MSTESMGFDVESDKIGPCRNAEEYAIEWLEKRGGPVSPAELAEEYDCTPGHMQDALRDSEEIARVEIGEYVLATEIDTESTDTVNPVESADMALSEQGSEATDGGTGGSPRHREDQSDGVPGTGTERDDMVSERELQQQRGIAMETVEEGGEIEAEESGNGIPIPVRAETLAIGAAVLLAVIVVVQVVRAAGNQESEQRDEDRDIEDVIGV